MKILNLEIFKFRNYQYLKFKADRNLNLIYGKNAMGKSNFLEAIYTITVGKPFRSARSSNLINLESSKALLKAEIESFGYIDKVEIEINKDGKNTYKINNEDRILKDYKKDFSSVIFSPADLNMVKQSPIERRNYIDNLICLINPVYEHNLSAYKKIIFQRNKLLKNNLHYDLLNVYNFQLANYGVKILKDRLRTIKKFEKFAKVHFERLSGGDHFKITYLSTIPLSNSEEEIEATFKDSLKVNFKRDIERRYTSIGPHRDDIDFKINNMSAKNFASQGEIRTIILALKLSEIDLIREYKKSDPILLLDDVFSELDKNRSSYLLDSIGPIQTFITSTDYDFENFKIFKGNFYEVINGKLKNRLGEDYDQE